MDSQRRDFRFDYDPGTIRCGRGSVAALADELASHGLERALVVCGRTVGSTPAVMDPVRSGLGDGLAGVFAETTPAKTLRTALDALQRARDVDADAIVAVGGGSSLDVAKVASALASHDDPEAVAAEAVETADLPVAADGAPMPIVAVPTTLAGADLSVVAGVTLSLDPDAPESGESGGVSDRRLMPEALVYDPALFETTPPGVRSASAMNGFNKAVEALYSPNATAITDGTATRGLALMQFGFGTLPGDDPDPDRLSDAVTGVLLAQYGISTPGAFKLGVIHAFGHGFSRDYDVHQGVAHGIVTPHVLRALFDAVDGRRHLLARALGIETANLTDGEVAEAVVDAVADVRDDLDLPTRLREIDGLDRADLDAVAEIIADDSLMDATPAGFDPSTDDIEGVLDAAW